MENKDVMYLIIRDHWIDGKWPEDFHDLGTTYIGIFDFEFEARKFLEALPLKGNEYTCEGDVPGCVRNFREDDPDGCGDSEYFRYKIIQVTRF